MGVNHLEGHIYSNWIEAEGNRADKIFPLLVLIVSGGHTELVVMEDHGRYQRLGGTIDDAAGEAFDKVARLLGLGYPGGPAVQRAAQAGDPTAYSFPRAWLPGTHDFSFSGLKTAVLRAVQALESGNPTEGRRLTAGEHLPSETVADLAASFQQAVVDVLVDKTVQAAQDVDATEICVCGGVSANAALRQSMIGQLTPPGFCAPLYLCTDNAAMIAAAGYFTWARGVRSAMNLDVIANLSLV